MKLTDWFPPDIKPAHPGVYELKGLPAPFLYWDGEAWVGAEVSPAGWDGSKFGHRMEFGTGYPSTRRWRGLAEKTSMKTVTQWFVIDIDGQPTKPGWWEVLYQWGLDDNYDGTRYWWDGDVWRYRPGDVPTVFGNHGLPAQLYRGLAEKPE